MKSNVIVIALSAFAAGAAIGWFAHPNPPEPHHAPRRGESPRKSHIAEAKTRVKMVTSVVTNTVHDVVTNMVVQEQRRGPEAWREELEKLKETNPTEYAARTNRMAQFRAQMLKNAENKLETLASIDTTGWSERQLEIHQRYQELIAKREELFEAMRFDSGATEEQRRAAMEQMRQLGSELHKASQSERNLLLNKAISEMGIKGAAAAEARETINAIISTTQEWGPPPGGRHRGGPQRR